MKTLNCFFIFFLVSFPVSSPPVFAGEPPKTTEESFRKTAATMQQQLDESLAALSALREQIAREKIPLSRKLSDLEGELVRVRGEYQQTSRLLDSRALDLSNLRNEIKIRQEEETYLSNLLSEYIRNLESRLHIAELQRYEEALTKAKLAFDNSNLSKQEIFQTQADLIVMSLDRLDEALGGTRFTGTAVDIGGLVKNGTFALVGPVALFRSDDGKSVGTAEQRLGSLEPSVLGFQNSGDSDAAAHVVTDSRGYFPLDPTLGNAHKIEATNEALWEHITKGGPVMIPILALAATAFLLTIYKCIVLFSLRKPSQDTIKSFLHAIARHNKHAAISAADAIGGPVGKMLVAGAEHLQERCELIEEIMYETVQATRLKLQSLLPFIAISASSAPLLGLLGTVTGIINTFKLLTVFGSGDVKSLSSGISEALITTEFGLIVAIPSLLLHAFLSRKARSVTDQMQKAAVAFINQMNKTPFRAAHEDVRRDTVMIDEE